MLTVATAAIYVTAIICTHLEKSNQVEKEVETKTIDLSLMLAAMLGDVIMVLLITC